ncbi:hypothetical protein HDV05_001603 [Chytridiales sp. JEL 0842]|nr:hypothetical protein HDV05_001603 [Chytridiales sp. JEL 0842]
MGRKQHINSSTTSTVQASGIAVQQVTERTDFFKGMKSVNFNKENANNNNKGNIKGKNAQATNKAPIQQPAPAAQQNNAPKNAQNGNKSAQAKPVTAQKPVAAPQQNSPKNAPKQSPPSAPLSRQSSKKEVAPSSHQSSVKEVHPQAKKEHQHKEINIKPAEQPTLISQTSAPATAVIQQQDLSARVEQTLAANVATLTEDIYATQQLPVVPKKDETSSFKVLRVRKASEVPQQQQQQMQLTLTQQFTGHMVATMAMVALGYKDDAEGRAKFAQRVGMLGLGLAAVGFAGEEMIASYDLLNVKQAAYALVARFLRDNGHHNTLEIFEEEAKDALDSLKGRVVSLEGKPLLAILEEYLVNQAKDDADQLVAERAIDDELAVADELPLPELKATFSDLHTNNILSVDIAHLPASTFGSITGEDSSTTDGESQTIPVIATGSADKSLRFTHAETGALLSITRLNSSPFLCVSFHPTLRHIILVSSMDGSHHLIDAGTGETVQSWKDHKKYIVRAVFSPNGKWFVTASYDRTANIYSVDVDSQPNAGILLPTYKLQQTLNFPGAVESLAFLPSNSLSDSSQQTFVVASRDDNCIHFVSVPSQPPLSDTPLLDLLQTTKWNMNPSNDGWVSFTAMCVAVSPSGNHMAVYTDATSGRIIIYRVPSDPHCLAPKSLSKPSSKPIVRPLALVRDLYGVDADGFSRPQCCWDATGTRVYATSDDGKIHVFDAASGSCVGKLEGHGKAVRGLVVDMEKDGKLYSCSFDVSVRVWG